MATFMLIFFALVDAAAAAAVAAAASAAPAVSEDSATAAAAPANATRSLARQARADSTCLRSDSAEGTETPSFTYSSYSTAGGVG